jgi:hypothetical protein
MKAIWTKYKLWIIAGAIVVVVLVYYFLVMRPKQTGNDPLGQYAIDSLDEQNYQALLALIQNAVPNEWPWLSQDIPQYFPGGARSTWGAPDVGGKRSKTGRLYTATGEVAQYPEWQANGNVQAWNLYQNYLAQAALKSVA